jgi:HSP20 family protein
MNSLIRWDPFREMMTLRSNMNRLFDDAFSNLPAERTNGGGAYSIALDVAEDEDNYVVKASVPGIPADNIDVTVSDNVLTIKGEIEDEREKEERNYHLRERRYGMFSRTISLPSNVEADEIDASYDNGVLTLQIPKAEVVKPRKITVKTS